MEIYNIRGRLCLSHKGVLKYLEALGISYTVSNSSDTCTILYKECSFNTNVEELDTNLPKKPMLFIKTIRKLYHYVIKEQELKNLTNTKVKMNILEKIKEYSTRFDIEEYKIICSSPTTCIIKYDGNMFITSREEVKSSKTNKHLTSILRGITMHKIYEYISSVEVGSRGADVAIKKFEALEVSKEPFLNSSSLPFIVKEQIRQATTYEGVDEILQEEHKRSKESIANFIQNPTTFTAGFDPCCTGRFKANHPSYIHIAGVRQNKSFFSLEELEQFRIKDISDTYKYFDSNLIKEMLSFNTNNTKQNKMDLLKRLEELRDSNPDFAKAIEDKFPEVIDNKPYVRNGSLFFKKQHPKNLYQVFHNCSGFHVRNITSNDVWSGTQRETKSDDLYLSKNDFIELLKQSSQNIKNISLVRADAFVKIHYQAFNSEV